MEPARKRQFFPVWEHFEKTDVYPNLYKLAVAFLLTPSSSVSPERVFSKTGEIIKKKKETALGPALWKSYF